MNIWWWGGVQVKYNWHFNDKWLYLHPIIKKFIDISTVADFVISKYSTTVQCTGKGVNYQLLICRLKAGRDLFLGKILFLRVCPYSMIREIPRHLKEKDETFLACPALLGLLNIMSNTGLSCTFGVIKYNVKYFSPAKKFFYNQYHEIRLIDI